MPKNINQKYLLLLLVGATGIGFSPIFAKIAILVDSAHSAGISPGASAFWRLALAVPIFLVSDLTLPKNSLPKMPKQNPWLLLIPGVFFAADLVAWHWAFQYTSVAKATLEANIASMLVALYGTLVLKEKFTRLFPLGVVIALVGLVILVGSSGPSSQGQLKGDLLGVLTAFCYAGYILSLKMLTPRFKISRIMLVTTLVGAIVIAGGIALFYGSLGPGILIPLEAETWFWLICLALIPQVAGQTMIAKSLNYLPVSFSAISLLWQPVVTAIMGWLILGQQMTHGQIAAGFLIMGGIFLAKRGSVF